MGVCTMARYLKRPRCDTNGGSETEVTVTSKRHEGCGGYFQQGLCREKGGFAAMMCITKTEKAESEAQRSKPKGTLESESRNAIL